MESVDSKRLQCSVQRLIARRRQATYWTFRFILCLIAVLWQISDIMNRPPVTTTALAANSTERSAEPPLLGRGSAVAVVLRAGQTLKYGFNIIEGQQVRLVIMKGDQWLKILVYTPPNHNYLELVSRRYGTLNLSFSATTSSRHYLEIHSLESDSVERRLELRVLEVVSSTPRHRLMDDAMRVAAEAKELLEHRDEASQHAAISKYSQAQSLWESAGDISKIAQVLCEMGDVYLALSQYRQALAHYRESLRLSAQTGDRVARLSALNGLAYASVYLGENQKASYYAQTALEIVKRLEARGLASADYKRARAQALNTLGEVAYSLGELRRSLEMFESARSLWSEVTDRRGEALAFLNLGYSHSDLGDLSSAFEHFQRSLTLSQSTNDGRGMALARTVLGGLHSLLGDRQLAITLHREAANYFKMIGNRQGEAAALNGVAGVYQDLNEYDAALDNYNQALQLYQAIGNRDFTALNKFLVGRVLFERGENKKASEYYQESLDLSRDVGDRVIEAHALKGLAAVCFSQGDVQGALSRFDSALKNYVKLGNRRSAAYVLNDIGHIYMSSGDPRSALASLKEALPLMRATSDRRGEALTLFNIARGERDRGDLNIAASLVKESIAISESMRTNIRNSYLRTTYFASVHQQYEFYIDLLMRLHVQHPDKGFAIAALLESEKGRARSLLDSLFDRKVRSTEGLQPDLLQRQQQLLQTLDEKAEYQMRLLRGKHTPQEIGEVSQEIHRLNIEYQDVLSRVRAESPRRAILTQPSQITSDDLQGIVKDNGSLLLEFALGDERSYLWTVSANEITSYELPNRSTIEELARRVYELLTMRQLAADHPSPENEEKIRRADAEYWQQAAVLSNTLFGPIAARLDFPRLLIVSDGFLKFIPFEAIPMPSTSSGGFQVGPAELLSFEHEIVGIPSALTLAALRSEENPPRTIAKRIIAVIADPVFEKDDPRLFAVQANEGAPSTAKKDDVYLSSALRDFTDGGNPQRISRLPSTLREANAIMSLTPRDQVKTAIGFAANKEEIVSADLGDFRIIHFATHGILNSEQPELSGVVLSLIDEQGNNRNGFLRLHDIYNFNLSADLVVLSACRTALGKNVPGEGIVGLSGGFIYAGAKSVVSSLWKVDDDATAELTLTLQNKPSHAASRRGTR